MTSPPAADRLRPSRLAAEAPERVALSLPDRTVRFGELPRLIEAVVPRLAGARTVECVAEPVLETFVTLWAALEQGVPFAPLHPRLPESRRAELRARLARTPPPPGTAAVVWTSGTTGEPRGVCLSRANLLAAAAASAANLPLGDDDGWLCALPLAHAGGLMIPIRCLVAGRAVVAAPHLEVSTLREAVDGRGATIASLVPTMLARLLEAGAAGMLRRLRAILLGGDAAPPRLLETCRAERLPVLCTYGLTETAGQVATQSPDEPAEPAAGVGRPLPGVEVRVADGGHILVRGPTVASALLGEPPRPADDWLDTGDLGHLDPRGRLHVTGRAGDVIVTGGENVHPAVVEAALASCPGVAAALVFGEPDPIWGQRVCAALVARDRPPPDAEVLAWAAARLPAHERPRRLVWLPSVPLTPTGKPWRAQARRLAAVALSER